MEAKKHRALLALLSSPTIKEAAKIAGIGEKTLHRWIKEDQEFRQAYREASREALQHTTTRLQQAAARAVDTLESIMMDKRANANARVTAAKTVLETAYKAFELYDLEARIEALEEAAQQKEDERWD